MSKKTLCPLRQINPPTSINPSPYSACGSVFFSSPALFSQLFILFRLVPALSWLSHTITTYIRTHTQRHRDTHRHRSKAAAYPPSSTAMAFDQDDPVPLGGGQGSSDAQDTLVEGYVVDHGVVWKKKHPSLSSLMGANGAAGDAAAAAPPIHAHAARQPPKVSVTLSEYLSAASPNPDPSCDFGWFTPTASASSLLAGDLQEGCYPAPSPSNHPTSFLFADARVDSGAKTASLSPESVFGGLGGVGGGIGGGAWANGERASISAAVAERGQTQEAVINFFDSNGNRTQEQEPPSTLQQEEQHRRAEQLAAPAEGRQLARRRGGGGGAGSGSDSSCGGGMGMRLLPVSRSRSTTTHLNSWHTLYANASESGKLSSCGRCAMHIRRPSFLISTRNFPEKPPTPRAWTSGRRESNNGGSGSGSSRGIGLKNVLLPNGPLLAAALLGAATRQRQQEDGGGEGSGPGCGSGETCKNQEQEEQRQSSSSSISSSSGVKPKSYSWAITEIRVRKPAKHFPFASEPPFAEYLIVVCIGRERLVAGWRRASDFEKLAQVARRAWMPKVSEEEERAERQPERESPRRIKCLCIV